MRLVVESVPIIGGVVGAKADVTWTKPARPGDSLRVDTEVLEIKSSASRPERGIVTMRSTTFNQNDETVQTMVCKLVVPRRQPLAAKK
jgi:acyl dehydratase